MHQVAVLFYDFREDREIPFQDGLAADFQPPVSILHSGFLDRGCISQNMALGRSSFLMFPADNYY